VLVWFPVWSRLGRARRYLPPPVVAIRNASESPDARRRPVADFLDDLMPVAAAAGNDRGAAAVNAIEAM